MDGHIGARWMKVSVRIRHLLEDLFACACIALITYCSFVLQAKLLAVSSLYLLIIVAVASRRGIWQASFISILAVACLDYFFMPPIFHFNITDPQDWAALAAFEFTALVITRLSAKEIISAGEAIFHRSSMEKLYELSRNSLLLDLHEPPGPQLAVLIHRIFGVRAVALFDKTSGRQDKMGDWRPDEDNAARECWLRGGGMDDIQTDTSYRIVQNASGSLGALALRGKLHPLVVDALAALTAIAFDRYQSFEKEEQADEAKRGEQLRTAVMDSLGHELKTPLATVQTASSGLLVLGGLNDSQFELVNLIDHECLRLNKLCARLLLTAKLESKQVGWPEGDLDCEDLISQVLASPTAEGIKDRIEVRVDESARDAHPDRELVTMVLAQYIDNARKYSAPGTPIRITARMSEGELVVSVYNQGSNVRIEDRERIFDRFYRALDSANSIPGTGIGLSIVRKAAEARHGHVWVVSDAKEGTIFFLSLPVSARRGQ
jgi:two-component system sensor histidine kinase KdpD